MRQRVAMAHWRNWVFNSEKTVFNSEQTSSKPCRHQQPMCQDFPEANRRRREGRIRPEAPEEAEQQLAQVVRIEGSCERPHHG